MSRTNIVSRAQCGKVQIYKKTLEFIDQRVKNIIKVVATNFSDGSLREEDVENADETNFIIKIDDGHTLVLRGDDEVRYDNLVSGRKGIK